VTLALLSRSYMVRTKQDLDRAFVEAAHAGMRQVSDAQTKAMIHVGEVARDLARKSSVRALEESEELDHDVATFLAANPEIPGLTVVDVDGEIVVSQSPLVTASMRNNLRASPRCL